MHFPLLIRMRGHVSFDVPVKSVRTGGRQGENTCESGGEFHLSEVCRRLGHLHHGDAVEKVESMGRPGLSLARCRRRALSLSSYSHVARCRA